MLALELALCTKSRAEDVTSADITAAFRLLNT